MFQLSPATPRDYGTPTADLPHGGPHFTRQSPELIEVLRQKSPAQVWAPWSTGRNSRQAVLAFEGDDYDGRQVPVAKKARGLTARYRIKKRAAMPRRLQAFASEGYSFDRGASRADRMVFRPRIDQ